ncbi:MAG: M23 family metallopeptidase [Elusimicrobia bacterium]|nr:M23 family metallopeptidase [Elusimicrobiota bacterium]
MLHQAYGNRRRTRWALLAGFFAAAVVFAAALDLLVHREGGKPLPNAKLLRVASGNFTGPLDTVFKDEGLGDAARAGISAALARSVSLRRLRREDSYSIVFSTAGALKYLVVAKDLNNYLLFPSAGGKFSVSVRPILDYTDVFSWSVDFLTEVRGGDKWTLAWDYQSDPSGKVLSPKITAAVYNGLETGRKAAAEYQGAYYDERGESLRNMFLRAPLHYRRISSYFTYKRFHPILKYVRPHLGIDYAAPAGTPVSAVADGTVSFSGWKGGNGRLIIVRHSSGYESTYGHLLRFAKGVRGGRRVGQGDVIGYVGSSGLSSGPHLDFRLKQNGKPLNFLKIKYRSSGGVSGKGKAAVAAAIKALSVQELP